MKRRQVLTGGAAIGIAGLAGCSEILSGGEATGNFENVAQWLPEPADVIEDQDHYQVTARSPARLANLVDDAVLRTQFAPNLDYANPTSKDVKYSVSVQADSPIQTDGPSFNVYVGRFNADWVEDRMATADGLERDSDIEGFAVFANEGDTGITAAYAVSNDAYIHTTDTRFGFDEDADALGILTTVIDAREGNIGRYHERNSDMELLVDDLSFGHRLNAGTQEATEESDPTVGQFENVVARGTTTIVEGESSDVEEILVFGDGRDIREREIEEYIEESSSFDSYRERPSYEIADRSVVIEGTRKGAGF